MRTRVLFVAEAVTLAHVTRASVLARSLDPARFEVHAAWDPRYNRLLGDLPFPVHPIRSLSSDLFLKRLARGAPMHDVQTLRGYVKEDLKTIARVGPALVVGDFRLSLAASARIAGVPLVTVANAYWSPYAGQRFHFPEYNYPLSGLVGGRAAFALFNLFRPLGFALHTRPLNTVLREHNLPALQGDIREMYTFGDHTAYADIPELVPIRDLPASHQYIGAVLWSPAVARPVWWDDLPKDRPIVYITPGSSGEPSWLPVVTHALAGMPLTILAATAGRVDRSALPSTALVADFLPGTEAAARAGLVICNGGSPTTAQALAAGVPVLGIPSNNMDQHLNMEAVRRSGAGEVLRGRGIEAASVRAAVERVLGTSSYLEAARGLARAHDACRVEARFPLLVDQAMRAGHAHR